jgi:trk system potassium uptake protein TrkA
VKVVIVGCGRVGGGLARELDAEGHEVVVIDQRVRAFTRLGKDFKGRAELGNGVDETVLRRVGIEDADAFVSVTSGDNRNLMAAQIAKVLFGVPRVITRVYDPKRSEVYRELGLETFCPTSMSLRVVRDFFFRGKDQSTSEPVLGGKESAA